MDRAQQQLTHGPLPRIFPSLSLSLALDAHRSSAPSSSSRRRPRTTSTCARSPRRRALVSPRPRPRRSPSSSRACRRLEALSQPLSARLLSLSPFASLFVQRLSLHTSCSGLALLCSFPFSPRLRLRKGVSSSALHPLVRQLLSCSSPRRAAQLQRGKLRTRHLRSQERGVYTAEIKLGRAHLARAATEGAAGEEGSRRSARVRQESEGEEKRRREGEVEGGGEREAL